MKKILLQSLLFTILFTCIGTTTLSAQQSNESKILTITIEMMDDDGNTQIKKIVQTGDEVDEDNIQAIIDEQVGDFVGSVEVDVDLQMTSSEATRENGSEEMEVTVDEDGNVYINGELVEEGKLDNQQVFVIESDDMEGLDEVKEMLSEMDVDIDLDELIENAAEDNDEEKEIRIITKSFTTEEHNTSNSNNGFLGVVTDNQADAGVKITEIVKGSAAEKAGLQVGDIIMSIDGETTQTHQDLVRQISAHQANETINIGYSRNGTTMNNDVVLGKRTNHEVYTFKNLNLDNDNSWTSKKDCSALCESMSTAECAKICGISEAECEKICDANAQNGDRQPHLGVTIMDTDSKKGVFIESVQRNSPASRAGLQEGDYILKFDNEKTNSFDDLVQEIKNHKIGDVVKVKISRNGKKSTKKLTLTAKPQQRKMRNRMRGNIGCCAAPKSSESMTEKRIIIRKIMDEDGNIVEEVIENDGMEIPKNTLDMVMVDIYPNPTTDEVNIRFKTEAKQATAVRILDTSGKEVFVKEIPNFNGDFNEQISLGTNENGIYFLLIQQGNNNYTKQIILNN